MKFVAIIGGAILLPLRSNAPVKLQNAGTDSHTSALLAENQFSENAQPRDAMTVLKLL